MTGNKRKKRLFQCFAMYAFGSSTPIAKTPTAKITRVTSSVIVFTVVSSPPPHDLGSIKFAA